MHKNKLVQIVISNETCQILKSFLKLHNFSEEIIIDAMPPKLVMDEATALDLRDCLIDNICYYFDINYELTAEGEIFESLIDEIYDAVDRDNN